MTSPKVYVIVPSLREVGPVKGAVAACNYLAARIDTALVVAKPLDGAVLEVDERVEIIKIGDIGGWLRRVSSLRQRYRRHAQPPVSISMCLSADLLNLLMFGCAHRIASVRGNLFKNYYYDYGALGVPIALTHTLLLHGFDRVLSMSNAMTRLLRRFGLTRISLIRNFIDESAVGAVRLPLPQRRPEDPVLFGFVGSLSERKQPGLLLDSLNDLVASGVPAKLRLIGDGPLRADLERRAYKLGIASDVEFLGHLSDPLRPLQGCDWFVLPSLSEGLPRAALEALYLGIPCILRDVDANRELIRPGVNGYLFESTLELRALMRKVTMERFFRSERSLLPPEFEQRVNCDALLQLVEDV